MTDSQVKAIVVDSLSGYLATGKTAPQIAADFATPNIGSGSSDSDLRVRLRAFIGSNDSEISSVLDSLSGARGTSSTFTRVSGSPATYSVVAD
jgi:hypothetical protein